MGVGRWALLCLLLVCAGCRADHVITFPPTTEYVSEVYNMTVAEFTATGKKIYNHTGASEVVMVVSDDWPLMEAFLAYHNTPRDWHDHHSTEGDPKKRSAPHTVQYPIMKLKRARIADIEDETGEYVDGLIETVALSWGLDRIDGHSKQSAMDGQYLGYLSGISNLRTVHLYVVDTGVFDHSNFDATVHHDFSAYPSEPADCNGTHLTPQKLLRC
jgi:hypothetical protein